MEKYVFTEKTQKVLMWMQDNGEATAADIADAVGLPVSSVNGIVTSALKRRGLADRKIVEGVKAKICYLTDKGLAADPYELVEG